jgi:hypothetical protein
MKKVLFLFALLCTIASLPVLAQKYKTGADSIKLNKELVEVNNDIAELTAKLTIAQNNLPGYYSKADKAVLDAQGTAQKSSDQASKATNGDLDDAKSAKKKAKKAANDAEDADDAKGNAKDQEKKIDKLMSELQKKQKKQRELEDMRTTIRIMHQ